jgi:hypothetical protein
MSDEDSFNGYLDGRDPNSPEPSSNRSWSYRHSFAVGRREIEGRHWDASTARRLAEIAQAKDAIA